MVSSVPAILQSAADPLGLTPIPEDNRQRFLRFRLCGENSLLLALQEITEVLPLEPVSILPVPEVAGYMLGVFSWRGGMLWLVDLNVLFGEQPLWQQLPSLSQAMVIVIQAGTRSVGLVVERAQDVELIDPETIHRRSDLSSPAVAPLLVGYLSDHGGAVLDAGAIIERVL